MLNASNDTVYVKSSYNVDLCDKASVDNPYKDRVQIMLDLGQVTPSDSLFGYDFELRYDTNNVALNAGLYFNTLTEYMEERGISFFADSGMALGYGLTFSINNPVYGNRKLVAMRGDYVGSCPDTTEIYLKYIEFTEEFTRKIVGYKPARIISYIEYSDDRYFYIAANDTINIDSVGSSYVDFKVQTIEEHDVNEFNVNIDKPHNNFVIDSIRVLSDNVTLADMNEDDDKITVRFIAHNNLMDDNLIRVFMSTKENIDDIEEISVKVDLLDNCSCVTNVRGCFVELYSNYVQDTTSVRDHDFIDYYYDNFNETLNINTRDHGIKTVIVYNLLGQMIETKNFNYQNSLLITTDALPSGTYVYQIIAENNRINNILIVK